MERNFLANLVDVCRTRNLFADIVNVLKILKFILKPSQCFAKSEHLWIFALQGRSTGNLITSLLLFIWTLGGNVHDNLLLFIWIFLPCRDTWRKFSWQFYYFLLFFCLTQREFSSQSYWFLAPQGRPSEFLWQFYYYSLNFPHKETLRQDHWGGVQHVRKMVVLNTSSLLISVILL